MQVFDLRKEQEWNPKPAPPARAACRPENPLGHLVLRPLQLCARGLSDRRACPLFPKLRAVGKRRAAMKPPFRSPIGPVRS